MEEADRLRPLIARIGRTGLPAWSRSRNIAWKKISRWARCSRMRRPGSRPICAAAGCSSFLAEPLLEPPCGSPASSIIRSTTASMSPAHGAARRRVPHLGQAAPCEARAEPVRAALPISCPMSTGSLADLNAPLPEPCGRRPHARLRRAAGHLQLRLPARRLASRGAGRAGAGAGPRRASRSPTATASPASSARTSRPRESACASWSAAGSISSTAPRCCAGPPTSRPMPGSARC